MENFDFHTIAPVTTPLEPNVALCSTPVKASIPVASLSAAEYLNADAHMVYVEQAEKAGDVSNLTALLKEMLSSELPYSSKRDVIVPVSLALNHLKKIAPRFRYLPAAVMGGGDLSDQLLSLDKQFIDLHWLKCNNHQKEVSAKGFEELFKADAFAEIADEFCRLSWKSGTKAVALNMSLATEWELAFFQSEGTRKTWDRIRKGEVRGSTVKVLGVNHIRCRLEDSTERQPQLRRYLDDWVVIWMAHRVSEHCPRPPSKIHELMTGKSIDSKTFKTKIENVQSRI